MIAAIERSLTASGSNLAVFIPAHTLVNPITGNTLLLDLYAKDLISHSLTDRILDSVLINTNSYFFRDYVDACDRNGMNLIHHACESIISGNEEGLDVLKYLLLRGANLNTRDNNGQTALHYLCCHKAFGAEATKQAVEAAQLLLDSGIPANIVDKNGDSSFSLAMERDYREMVKLLMESGKVSLGREENFDPRYKAGALLDKYTGEAVNPNIGYTDNITQISSYWESVD